MYITKLKGVGKKTGHLFLKQGISTVNDLIDLIPTYENYNLTTINESSHQNIITIECVIDGEIKQINTKKAKFVKFDVLYNNNTYLEVYAFNQLFLTKVLRFGQTITIKGKYDHYLKRVTANKILTKSFDESTNIVSHYKVDEVPSGKVRNLIKYSLENHANLIKENLPTNFINHFNLLNKRTSYNYLHFPKEETEINEARNRFKYEETYFNENALIKDRENRRTRKIIKYNISFVKEVIDKIPYTLTNDQKDATNVIFKQFKDIYPLSHVIVGDVGTGKTIVAFIAAIGMISAGYQVAFMAPTEILANQHYYNFLNLFNMFNAEILTSKINNRKAVLENIKNRTANIVFGTHSLISDEVVFDNLGLAIIDEQHKFGVNVRNQLKDKGRALDFIYLSATPIPRSLEMALFGSLNLIRIDDKPQGRKDIQTLIFNTENLDEVVSKILENQQQKGKTYIVVPAIDTEKHEYTIDEIYPLLQTFIKDNLFVLHGKQTKEEQNTNLEGFISNDNSILLATSIIEVGIDDANATLMVIIGANYFGLSALHQLRGRVGRGNRQSFCYLITENEDEERLLTMTRVNDGLKLAEIDLKMRGPGSLLGINQSGFIKYKFLDLTTDSEIIQNVRNFLSKKS